MNATEHELHVDDRGRVVFPKELRERYGGDYWVVELDDGLKLVPIPEDPIATLRSAGSEKLRNASIEEIREGAERRGREETTAEVEGRGEDGVR
jgi:bifunctional DNA-binding transcriptional regulator/antitoxin component of YhaV-PrlF toxin-antitoxin module